MCGDPIGIYVYRMVYESKIILSLKFLRDIFHKFEKAQW